MFIKFESDNREQVAECTEYLLFCDKFRQGDEEPGVQIVDDEVVPQHCKYITIIKPATEGRYLIFDRPGHWRRAYVMNNEGQTIETIYAPPLPPFEKDSSAYLESQSQ